MFRYVRNLQVTLDGNEKGEVLVRLIVIYHIKLTEFKNLTYHDQKQDPMPRTKTSSH